MTRSLPGRRVVMLCVLLGTPLAGCDAVGSPSLIQVEALGDVVGGLFIDLNGNGQAGSFDDGVRGWPVRLEQPAGGLIANAVTDTAGFFAFENVPVGRAVLRIDDGLLGDTLEFFGVAFDPVTIAMGDTAILRPGVTFPKVSVSEARAYDLGKPLFTTGVALNSINQFVATLHVQDLGGGAVIRVTDLVGRQVTPGDSVRVRGRTSRSAGQPILTLGDVFSLGVSGAVLEPLELTTSEADAAFGGTLDGALVQVREAEIVEVEDLDEEGIRLVVDDGTGGLEILIRSFFGVGAGNFDPDLFVMTRVRGLLVPRTEAGETHWTLWPRTTADVRRDPKGEAAPGG